MIKAFGLSAALALASAAAVTAQDLCRGNLGTSQQPYDRGVYADALRLVLIDAEQDDVIAQLYQGRLCGNGLEADGLIVAQCSGRLA